MSEELRVVTTVGNQAESEMVMEALSEAGIRSMPQMHPDNIRLGPAAPLDIYVEAERYDEAMEVLNAAVPSEAELEALSQEAVREDPPPEQ
jgi:hypothetical protein